MHFLLVVVHLHISSLLSVRHSFLHLPYSEVDDWALQQVPHVAAVMEGAPLQSRFSLPMGFLLEAGQVA